MPELKRVYLEFVERAKSANKGKFRTNKLKDLTFSRKRFLEWYVKNLKGGIWIRCSSMYEFHDTS